MAKTHQVVFHDANLLKLVLEGFGVLVAAALEAFLSFLGLKNLLLMGDTREPIFFGLGGAVSGAKTTADFVPFVLLGLFVLEELESKGKRGV